MLVVVAGLRGGRKVVLAVESGARESTASWSAILRDLQQRGLQSPRLVIWDGHLGIWGALANVFPTAGCFWHRHDCRRGRRQPASNRGYWIPSWPGTSNGM